MGWISSELPLKLRTRSCFRQVQTSKKIYYTDVPRCVENLTSVSEYLDKSSLSTEKSTRVQRKHSFQVNLDFAYCIRVCQFWWYITCVLSKDVIRTSPPKIIGRTTHPSVSVRFISRLWPLVHRFTTTRPRSHVQWRHNTDPEKILFHHSHHFHNSHWHEQSSFRFTKFEILGLCPHTCL